MAENNLVKEKVNPNLVWARAVVGELVASGLRHAVIAPGSRSTPLVFAFTEQEGIKTYTLIDERSAAFFALGLAKASGRPAALVCTSGTAAANFYPAVVEAHQAGVPLLVLSADRPPELQFSGANQSIDQTRLYGSFALWSVDVALPETEASPLLLRSLRTLVARAYATSTGSRPGVVHLNFPFRKPLEPTSEDIVKRSGEARAPFTHIPPSTPRLSDDLLNELADTLATCKRGAIVCGVDSPRSARFRQALAKLSEQTGFPILADAASGVRFSEDLTVLSGFDSSLNVPAARPALDAVLRFGRTPTSASLGRYLESLDLEAYWQISGSGVWADDTHRLTAFLQHEEVDFCKRLTELLEARAYQKDEQVREKFARLEQLTWNFWQENLETFFDGAAVRTLVKRLPEDSLLFVGNSLAVRHVEQFGRHRAAGLQVYANRGASGIDGNISTGLGLGAAQPERPLYILVGDLTFYHDINGLAAIARCNVPVTLVVLNNGGGGIFHRLPVSDFEPTFTEYFLTPQPLDFSHAAELYGLEHHRITDLKALHEALDASTERSKLVEVITSSHEDHQTYTELMNRYKAFLEETL